MRKKLMQISEFAELSGISRKALIFYDKSGILHPREVDPQTGYRYYSYRQIDTASVIVSLREAGMSLADIKEYLARKSPGALMATLAAQERELAGQIERLGRIQGMIRARIEQTARGIAARPGEVCVERQEEENLFLGPPLPADYDLADGWTYLPQFYAACRAQGIQCGFTVGTTVAREQLDRMLWSQPSHYFYRLPKGQYPIFHTKPRGLYVVGVLHADYGHTESLYRVLLRAMEEKGLRVCGDAYEEYLIDEVSEADPRRYLLRISVQVGEG